MCWNAYFAVSYSSTLLDHVFSNFHVVTLHIKDRQKYIRNPQRFITFLISHTSQGEVIFYWHSSDIGTCPCFWHILSMQIKKYHLCVYDKTKSFLEPLRLCDDLWHLKKQYDLTQYQNPQKQSDIHYITMDFKTFSTQFALYLRVSQQLCGFACQNSFISLVVVFHPHIVVLCLYLHLLHAFFIWSALIWPPSAREHSAEPSGKVCTVDLLLNPFSCLYASRSAVPVARVAQLRLKWESWEMCNWILHIVT